MAIRWSKAGTTAEATEFSYYLDSMDTIKRSGMRSETFKLYNIPPAEPSNWLPFEMMQENGSQNEKENAGAIEAKRRVRRST